MTSSEKVLYTAKTHMTSGQDGASRSDDGCLDVKLYAAKGIRVNAVSDVLKKPPEWTWVVFQEVEMENWGWGGMPVAEYRKRLQAGKADDERRS